MKKTTKKIGKKTINIAINGFGRIGRAAMKAFLEKNPSGLNIKAINDLTDTKTLAHLFKFDSCYGEFKKSVSYDQENIVIGNAKYRVLAEKDPSKLPWQEMEIDLVIESTGFFRTKEEAGLHLRAGAKKVIISAPAKGPNIKTIVLGVNQERVNKNDRIISMASCTTNCLAPVTDIIRRNFGIKKAIMTTIHSYTADQRIVDGPHKDLRRARAAALNISPTTTGAALATGKTIPQIAGKFDGMAVRVPTPVGSLCDIVFITNKKVTEKIVNQTLIKASKSARLKGILGTESKELVSSDFVGNPLSAIVDLPLTKVIGGDMLKIIAWYDNEWGYSCRLIDLAEYLAKKRLV